MLKEYPASIKMLFNLNELNKEGDKSNQEVKERAGEII